MDRPSLPLEPQEIEMLQKKSMGHGNVYVKGTFFRADFFVDSTKKFSNFSEAMFCDVKCVEMSYMYLSRWKYDYILPICVSCL